MELKRHASYWMNWKRWEHLNGRDRENVLRNSHTVKIKIQKMEKSQLRILILTHTDFSYLQVLNSKNQNLIRLIITILILIISILSGSEETSLWMGYDGFQ